MSNGIPPTRGSLRCQIYQGWKGPTEDELREPVDEDCCVCGEVCDCGDCYLEHDSTLPVCDCDDCYWEDE